MQHSILEARPDPKRPHLALINGQWVADAEPVTLWMYAPAPDWQRHEVLEQISAVGIISQRELGLRYLQAVKDLVEDGVVEKLVKAKSGRKTKATFYALAKSGRFLKGTNHV